MKPVLSTRSALVMGLFFLIPVAQAQAPMSAKTGDAFVQPDRAKDQLTPGRVRLHLPHFRMGQTSEGMSLVSEGKLVEVKANGPTSYTVIGTKALPPLPAEADAPFLFHTQASGVTFLHPNGYYQLNGKGWNLIGLVPSRFLWNFKWGGAEILPDGNLFMITGDMNQYEVVNPHDWSVIASAPYSKEKNHSGSKPSYFREPVTTHVGSKVIVFYPYSLNSDVYIWDYAVKSYMSIDTPWRAGSKEHVLAKNGSKVSNTPFVGQWYPVSHDKVNFLGVNGGKWFSYTLDLNTLKWTPWNVNHDGWEVPYGLPFQEKGLINIDLL